MRIAVLFVASFVPGLWGLGPEPPSCLYEAYGCVYYIWNHHDGTGDALVTCDEGGTFSFYSGRFGGCP